MVQQFEGYEFIAREDGPDEHRTFLSPTQRSAGPRFRWRGSFSLKLTR